ncbi:hypothetical protein DLM78_18125 [Leptospira stimsonii]|uniref:Uncharacterized protein n=1 Tax=Leptospira stimsonii TaxID=2202203 RepID=A0A396Z189_9LEPT|nr:hypothetical protein DLM78_18125 [Leptospira stimsonii]RHX89212.1 hypothetical protein DLM75_15305 [Leptospira stimsonii]
MFLWAKRTFLLGRKQNLLFGIILILVLNLLKRENVLNRGCNIKKMAGSRFRKSSFRLFLGF